MTLPVCNIYDMGGNAHEYTTEFSNNEGQSYVYRGGSNNGGYINGPAGAHNETGTSYKEYTFRVTLFIK